MSTSRASCLPGQVPERPRCSPTVELRRAAGLEDLEACWDPEGKVDEAGGIVYRLITTGGNDRSA